MAAEAKTTENDNSVNDFINTVADEQKKADSYEIIKLMQGVTKEEPKMWGGAIVGFGRYHYKYASGHEGDAPLIAFSPRKQNISLYIMGVKKHPELMAKLGKYKIAVSCLYVKKLADVDEKILVELMKKSIVMLNKTYGNNSSATTEA